MPGPTSTIGAPVEHLDLATVIKVSQAVSGEIVLEKLIDTLMRTAHRAGRRRARPADSSRGGEPRIEAEATTSGETVVVQLRDRAGDRGRAAGISPPLRPAHAGERRFSTMPRLRPRLPPIHTSSSARLGPFSACR